ncbi:MAG TPA: AbrB/MazE/SpoVT family DNA-binding domain-containing protein [Longimicrobiales bacterium]
MSKVTSKLQVTIPKRLAEEYGIKPGDEIEWIAAGESIRIVPAERRPGPLGVDVRLDLFDRATERQRERERAAGAARERPVDGRGWTRAELYDRGRAG